MEIDGKELSVNANNVILFTLDKTRIVVYQQPCVKKVARNNCTSFKFAT